jgi:hypothetical protein
MNEWRITDRIYSKRTDSLRNGTGSTAGARLSYGSTVFQDSAVDFLYGEAGTDWFLPDVAQWIGPNQIPDGWSMESGEQIW